jgi:Tripartite tricarboxylate transporter TctB family
VQLKNQKDFFSGLLFMAVGGGFAWAASRYPLGHAAAMGPGYFPLLLGALLTLLGALIVFKAMVFETEDGGRFRPWAWRPMLAIVLANGLFGLLMGGLSWLGLPPMGLLLSAFALSLVAAHASSELRWKERLWLALLLALGSALVLILWLGLPMPAWPVFASL